MGLLCSLRNSAWWALAFSALACATGHRASGASAGGDVGSYPAPPRLTGGFIAYWANMMERQATEWCRVVRSMDGLGMKTIVVQRLVYVDSAQRAVFLRDSLRSPAADPTRAILACAGSEQRIYIGLWEDTRFDARRLADSAWMDTARRETLALLDSIDAHRYQRQAAFAGCYLPLEPFNYRSGVPTRWFKQLLHETAARCHQLAPGAQLAISAYFNPPVPGRDDLSGPAEMGAEYAALLEGSGVDVLLLQDGVGTRTAANELWYGKTDAYLNLVPAYYGAMEGATRRAGVQVWAVVELFDLVDNTTISTGDTSRVRRQLLLADGTRQRIGYDFYHHLNPCIPDEWVNGAWLSRSRFTKRQALTQWYSAEVGLSAPC